MESLYKKARVINSKDLNSIEIEVTGSGLEMNVHTITVAHMEDYEVLEVVDYWDGDGYIEYYCDLFKGYKFIADACFEREGQDFIPLEITNPQLTIEPIKETA